MRWSEIKEDWSFWGQVIHNRFPQLPRKELEQPMHDRRQLEAKLARSHQLSLTEAREEIEDLIFVQSLAREVTASEYRSGARA